MVVYMLRCAYTDPANPTNLNVLEFSRPSGGTCGKMQASIVLVTASSNPHLSKLRTPWTLQTVGGASQQI